LLFTKINILSVSCQSICFVYFQAVCSVSTAS